MYVLKTVTERYGSFECPYGVTDGNFTGIAGQKLPAVDTAFARNEPPHLQKVEHLFEKGYRQVVTFRDLADVYRLTTVMMCQLVESLHAINTFVGKFQHCPFSFVPVRENLIQM